MIAFAALLERLVFTLSRNAKIALLRHYFATEADPDRGIALAAVTGELAFSVAKPGLIRELAAARTDPVLFDWSYDYVGDLAETVALMWPVRPGNAPPPSLPDVVEALETEPKIVAAGTGGELARCIGRFGSAGPAEAHHGRAQGGARPPASPRSPWPRSAMSAPTRWKRCGTGSRPPYTPLFAWLEGRGERPDPLDNPVFPPSDARPSAGGAGTWPRCSRMTGARSGNGTASGSSWFPRRQASACFPAGPTTSRARFPRSSMQWSFTPSWMVSCWWCAMAWWRRSPTFSNG